MYTEQASYWWGIKKQRFVRPVAGHCLRGHGCAGVVAGRQGHYGSMLLNTAEPTRPIFFSSSKQCSEQKLCHSSSEPGTTNQSF